MRRLTRLQSKLAAELGITVKILNGTNLDNLAKPWTGRRLWYDDCIVKWSNDSDYPHAPKFQKLREKTFAFSPQTTLIVGPNTAGKTNILEAIMFCVTGKSFRADQDREAIGVGK